MKLFGNLWIGQHPTPLQGKYQVLFLDFSQITGNIDKLEDKFNSYLSINLDAFVRQYAEFYQAEKDEILAQEDSICTVGNAHPIKYMPTSSVI